ncbi:MAG: helix-turn-helix domain-containing protein [Finegoldia magna]
MDLLKKVKKHQSQKFKKQKDIEIILWKGLKMKTFDNYFKEQLEDKEFKNEYESIQPELDIIRAMVSARTSQNLTQKQLSEKTGIDQSDISKLENGTRNPSINLLKRLADGLGMDLKIEFVQKNTQISK